MLDAIREYTGTDISEMDEFELRKTCDKLEVPNSPEMGKGKLIDAIFSEKCEYNFVQPTFIIDYPTETSPLTKMHRSNTGSYRAFRAYDQWEGDC